ncbi:TPA: hypothetical protein NJ163_001165 [Vibrio parahaemolyticus]|nr:hypothetical protein [Vibrio parahaemolyticus]HCG6407330.1 hypothetical protein [Vibrio parahaemolyticus]
MSQKNRDAKRCLHSGLNSPNGLYLHDDTYFLAFLSEIGLYPLSDMGLRESIYIETPNSDCYGSFTFGVSIQKPNG